MRLLNTSTLEVEEFLGASIPEYVILSHTWEEEEVTFQDIQSGRAVRKKGFSKIKNCCRRAIEDGFAYCWIDTCCIDKNSSAELSEAINSMYQWYKNSRICYAYLGDFEESSEPDDDGYGDLDACRWWTRGWTLQELLAPSVVEFYSAKWVEVGSKLSLRERIAHITGIDEDVLGGADPLSRNVAETMLWAARRSTTRIEDRAYCLLGLFGANMPLLYGEGNRAFLRLQEEIMKVKEDYTMFTWAPKTSPGHLNVYRGLLADSPSDFVISPDQLSSEDLSQPWSHSWGLRHLPSNYSSLFDPPKEHNPPFLTSRGLRITLPMLEISPGEYYACLTLLDELGSRPVKRKRFMVCVILTLLSLQPERFVRRGEKDLAPLPETSSKDFQYRSIYVTQPPPNESVFLKKASMPSLVLINSKIDGEYSLKCYESSWVSMERLLTLRHSADTSTDSSSNNGISTTFFSSSSSSHRDVPDMHYAQRLHSLKDAFIDFNDSEIFALAMDIPPQCCLFLDVDTMPSYRFSNVIGFLAFGHESYGENAILVQFSVYDDRELCHAKAISLEDLKNDVKGKDFLINHMGVFYSDRATVILDGNHSKGSNEDGNNPSNIRVTVHIRRVASAMVATSCIRRYMVSVSHKRVRVTTGDAVEMVQ